MKTKNLINHLFRHQYGKMVSVLTRLFGLSYLETIEDAVQDTFVKAMLKWRVQIPDHPEAWLIKAAKNRAIDLLRKIKADDNRLLKLESGPSVIAINDLFLSHEIEDSELRMIFTACHPILNPKDQIAFALKTIAGFSNKEVAAALLLKEETVKKRLTRARKTIKDSSISFSIPSKKDMKFRLDRVHEVLYLIFNEGFHSTKAEMLIRKELCGEAIRLCKMILKKEHLRTGTGYALFALFCFHSARIETKLMDDETLIDLKKQDRSKWHFPLIYLGNDAMSKSMDYDDVSTYHLEAAIAAEHLKAKSFEATDWNKILSIYQVIYETQTTPFAAMNIAIVLLQLNREEEALAMLDTINPQKLEKRAYLYYGIKAEYYILKKEVRLAVECIDIALTQVSNRSEKKYLEEKKQRLLTHLDV